MDTATQHSLEKVIAAINASVIAWGSGPMPSELIEALSELPELEKLIFQHSVEHKNSGFLSQELTGARDCGQPLSSEEVDEMQNLAKWLDTNHSGGFRQDLCIERRAAKKLREACLRFGATVAAS